MGDLAGPPTVFHVGPGEIASIPVSTRIHRVYLGVFGVRRTLSYHLFRRRRDEQERKRYLKAKSHDAVDDKSESPEEDVFILPERF